MVLQLVLNSIRTFSLSLLLHLVIFLIWKVLATAIVWVFQSECIKEILLEPNNYRNSMLSSPISFGLVSLTSTNFLKFALLMGHSEISSWLYIYIVIIVVYCIYDSCLAAIPRISVDKINYQEYTPAYLSTCKQHFGQTVTRKWLNHLHTPFFSKNFKKQMQWIECSHNCRISQHSDRNWQQNRQELIYLL